MIAYAVEVVVVLGTLLLSNGQLFRGEFTSLKACHEAIEQIKQDPQLKEAGLTVAHSQCQEQK